MSTQPQTARPQPPGAQPPGAQLPGRRLPGAPTLDEIHAAVAWVTGVGTHFILADARTPHVASARAVTILAMRHLRGMSWPQIGDALNRSHSSVFDLAEAHRGQQRVQHELRRVTERLIELRSQASKGEDQP